MSAVAAEFVDFKLVKTRSAAQLVFEVPIEKADEVLDFLGGVPRPGRAIWVGMARISVEPEAKKEQHPLVTRAVMLCKDERFQRWVSTMLGFVTDYNEDGARRKLLVYCGITSRSELATNEEAQLKFLPLEAKFIVDVGLRAERR